MKNTKNQGDIEMGNTLHYGKTLAEKLRNETADFSKLSNYEQFIHNRGFEFATEESFKNAYDRMWKSTHEILLTKDEFIAEVGEDYSIENIEVVFDILSDLCIKKLLDPIDMYIYARRKYCINDPRAIIWYWETPLKIHINKCSDDIPISEAIISINRNWGFEASEIKIIGKPYYCATDFQFIRFDVCGISWLWHDGFLCTVC